MASIAIARNPMHEIATTENITTSKGLKRMLGLSLHSWEDIMVAALALAGVVALAIGIATFCVVRLQRTEIATSNEELERYKIEASAASDRLRNETARLTAENLALQTVLLPRTVGLIGFDGPPKASEWFRGFERWAGTKLLIQVVPGDLEAQNLANEIAIVLSKFGWAPEFINEARSGVSLNLSEGLSVTSPASYKSWDPNNEAQQVFATLREAAISLARALTNAGLGIGSYPVSGANGLMIVVDFPPDSEGEAHNPFRNFFPKLDGVYLQVGSRPVGATVAWIKQGRPDIFGNKAGDPASVEPHK
jgi:hypothetical protein